MGCCGQKRSQSPAASRPVWPVPAAHARSEPTAVASNGAGRGMSGVSAGGRNVVLRYRERARVLVRGPVTGRTYEFSAKQSTQSIEARDAEALLRTRHFVRA